MIRCFKLPSIEHKVNRYIKSEWLILRESLCMSCRFLISVLIILCASCSSGDENLESSSTRFSLIDNSYSKLDFSNDLKVDLATKYNLLDYDYFYNGAGVGIADINNDGLEDVFLTGNMVDNKLFLNKGDLVFEDISSSAGINVQKYWSNGVTFADVDNDGWLDIYISQGGPGPENERANVLLINQKDLSFQEAAKDFGLDDKGISTQSVFFDFDQDDDLDCFVMNESVLYGYDPISFLQTIASNKKANEQSLSRLYENIDGTFKDVSLAAGINKPSFGLGLVVTDLNNDDLLDIYIANDYYLPDAMYINTGNGSFKDEIKKRTNQVSMFGMGADAEDINQDGHPDLFVLDMAASDHFRSKTLMASMNTADFDLLVNDLRFQHQYMFNSMQLSNGDKNFKNVSHLAGLAKTDWSWAGLMADFDSDGDKDVFVTNGYRRYGLDNDFKLRVNETKQAFGGAVPLDKKNELYYSMPEGKLPNLMFQNQGSLHFEDVSTDWGFDAPTFSNGAAFSDLDNDGDLDIVINNIDQQVMLYKNNNSDNSSYGYLNVKTKGKTSEDFAKITVKFSDQSEQTGESKRVRGYRSAVSNIAHFGIKKDLHIEEVIVDWRNGKQEKRTNVKVNQKLVFDIENAMISIEDKDKKLELFSTIPNGKFKLNYIHRENKYDDFAKEILLPMRQSTLGPYLSSADVNGDGLMDLFVGGAAGFAGVLYLQNDSGFEMKQSPVFTIDKAFEDLGSAFLDVDNDGDFDLFICSGGNAFDTDNELYINRLYLNDGNGEFRRDEQQILNSNRVQSAKALAADLNNDGMTELIVANRIQPQQYPIHAPSIIYEWENGELIDATQNWCPELNDFGIINDLTASDYDGDGDLDLIAVGEWTGIGIFENIGGELIKNKDLENNSGWWYSITETDINKDGKPDFILGNMGLNSKYKASVEKPFKVYADDLDENGSVDIVLSNKYKSVYVPLRGKECSSQQMPFIAEKYPSYEGFANASLIDIYGDKISTAYSKEVVTFESKLMLNTDDGFVMSNLPMAAQEFPILDCISTDLNQDGFDDLLIVGNIYQTEVETPRLDAGKGLVLLSTGKDDYLTVPNSESGLEISGDAKSMIKVSMKKQNDIFIIGKNQGLLQIVQSTL